MDKKVYALFHYNGIMRIESNAHWQNDAKRLLDSGEEVMHHNNCYFLSFSRSALRKKADEIKQCWIEEHKNAIEEHMKAIEEIEKINIR